MAYNCPRGPTQEQETCPYNRFHSVSKFRIRDHVEKCRRNWKLDMVKQRKDIDVFTCKHNPDHIIYAPELIWHEARCEDGKKVRGYQLNVQPFKEAGLWNEDDLAEYEPDLKEQEEIWMGVNPGMVISVEDWGKACLLEEVKNPALKRIRDEEDRMREMEEQTVREKKDAEMREAESKMTPEELEEHRQWNTFLKGPKWNYIKNLRYPKAEWCRYPPDLTKAQRKIYEKQIYKADMKAFLEPQEDQDQDEGDAPLGKMCTEGSY